MNKHILNVLIVGVGGQGVLLASEIAAETFVKAGYDVKMSATYGMAQRGGAIFCHLRIGEKIYSPLISRGEADILMAMELTEANRWIEYLKKNGLMILWDRYIFSNIVTSGVDKYAENLRGEIRRRCKRVIEIPYSEIVKLLKNLKASNMFILGVFSNYFSLKKEYWRKTIKERVPSGMRDSNLAAFGLGRKKFHSHKNRKIEI